VADRLFEGEEAVLHVIERIVAPWVFGSTQRHLVWTRDFRTALGCRPDFLESLSRDCPMHPDEGLTRPGALGLCQAVYVELYRRIKKSLAPPSERARTQS
jgi:hypothetical protein